MKWKLIWTSDIKNDTVDPVLLLGQETAMTGKIIPDMPYPHLLKHVEVEILNS